MANACHGQLPGIFLVKPVDESPKVICNISMKEKKHRVPDYKIKEFNIKLPQLVTEIFFY